MSYLYYAAQERFPEKLRQAEDSCCTLCLPHDREEEDQERLLRRLPEEFFAAHVLREQSDEGWFRCGLASLPSLIVERSVLPAPQGRVVLKLLSAPGYHPSFKRGLHSATINRVAFGVNKVLLSLALSLTFS